MAPAGVLPLCCAFHAAGAGHTASCRLTGGHVTRTLCDVPVWEALPEHKADQHCKGTGGACCSLGASFALGRVTLAPSVL